MLSTATVCSLRFECALKMAAAETVCFAGGTLAFALPMPFVKGACRIWRLASTLGIALHVDQRFDEKNINGDGFTVGVMTQDRSGWVRVRGKGRRDLARSLFATLRSQLPSSGQTTVRLATHGCWTPNAVGRPLLLFDIDLLISKYSRVRM